MIVKDHCNRGVPRLYFRRLLGPIPPAFLFPPVHPSLLLHCRSSFAVFKVLWTCYRGQPWLLPARSTPGSTTTSRVRCAANWRTQMGQPGRAGVTYNARTPQMNCGYATFRPPHSLPLIFDAANPLGLDSTSDRTHLYSSVEGRGRGASEGQIGQLGAHCADSAPQRSYDSQMHTSQSCCDSEGQAHSTGHVPDHPCPSGLPTEGDGKMVQDAGWGGRQGRYGASRDDILSGLQGVHGASGPGAGILAVASIGTSYTFFQ